MTVAFPYRVPSDAAVQAGAWLLKRGDRFVPAPALIADWDSATELSLTREVALKIETLAAETGLQRDTLKLDVVVQWRVSDSLLTGLGCRHVVTGDTTAVDLGVTLPGRVLGGSLTLSTSLMLHCDVQAPVGPYARLAGSVLWRDAVKRIRLRGSASRLPITKVDFKQLRIDQTAPWFIRIDGDLTSPAMGAIQLLLNTRREDVSSLLEGESGDESAREAVHSALYVAVGRALIERALIDVDLDDDDSFEDEELGAVLLAQVRLRFPGRNLDELRALRHSEPARFNALVEGRYGLFRGSG